jgi:hypothetical protein
LAAGEHPGPTGSGNLLRGRGAPQIDILGYLDADLDTGMVSESYRFAPFSTSRTIRTGTTTGVLIENQSDTELNTYNGTSKYVFPILKKEI